MSNYNYIKNKEFIYEYWGKIRLGREMIESNHVSESDLLFLIPNNVKRTHGLPLTRISGKKKRKQKEQRKRFILSFKLFDIIEDIVEETIVSTWSQNDFFDKFVDVKNFAISDKNKFKSFDESNIVTIPTSTKPIRMYLESK